MNRTLVQEQFGKNAAEYLTSKPHAQGKSLERLVALTNPQKDWRVLDIATGGGHVAYTFAPHVARVWATDITQEMLDQVKAEAAKRGLANIRVAYAKAEALPFEDASFDLVTCRIAPHHFDSIPDFLAEVHRVLKPGAAAAIADNVVPAGAVGDYITAFERCATRATCAPGRWRNGARPSRPPGFPLLTRRRSTRRSSSRPGRRVTTPSPNHCCWRCWRWPRPR
jgi:ubiquinone/menaquinone biosynthesis C-methylase UbiE